MRLLPILALLTLAPPVAAAGLCDDPAPWPGGPEAAVVLEGLMAIEPGRAGDGPNAPEPIEMTGDVLGIGALPGAGGGQLAVTQVVCVRERPEWLGLVVRNDGAADTGGRLALTLPDGRVLEAQVPSVPAGGERSFFVRASDPIAAAAVSLHAR